MLKKHWSLWIIAAALFLSVFVLYFRVHTYGVINLDDYDYIYNAQGVDGKITLAGILWAFQFVDYGIWMPATWLSYMLDASVFNKNLGMAHVHNVFLHACNTVLLFFLLLQIFKQWFAHSRSCFSEFDQLEKKPATAPNDQTKQPCSQSWGFLLTITVLVSAFWALHPLRVEPVSWLSSRKDVLFLFWELGALYMWVKRLAYPSESDQRHLFLFGAILCFAMACLSKPTAMTFPLLAILIDYLCIRSFRWHDYIYLGVLAIIFAIATAMIQGLGGAFEMLAGVPFTAKLFNAAVALGRYFFKMFWPTDLAVQCIHRWPRLPLFVWPGLITCAVVGSIFAISVWRCVQNEVYKKNPVCEGIRVLAVSIGFFLLSLAPTLGVAGFGYHAFADRFTYLPAIGLSILLGCGFLMCSGFVRYYLIGAFVFIIGFQSFLSYQQIGYWQNDQTLFERTLQVDGQENYAAHYSLGIYYYDIEHDLDKTIEHFEKTERFNTDIFRHTYVPYIFALIEKGQLKKAQKVASEFAVWIDQELWKKYEKLSEDERYRMSMLDPRTTLVYAAINWADGKTELAKEQLQQLLKSNPKHTFVNYLAGSIAFQEGDKETALAFFKKSMNFSPPECIQHRFLAKRIAKLEKEK